jgi:hypothetical protein
MSRRIHIIVPEELLAAVDAAVGPRRRSEFFAAAAERTLDYDRRRKLIEEFGGSIKPGEVPEWDTPESTLEWVREQRRPTRPDPWEEVNVDAGETASR